MLGAMDILNTSQKTVRWRQKKKTITYRIEIPLVKRKLLRTKKENYYIQKKRKLLRTENLW